MVRGAIADRARVDGRKRKIPADAGQRLERTPTSVVDEPVTERVRAVLEVVRQGAALHRWGDTVRA